MSTMTEVCDSPQVSQTAVSLPAISTVTGPAKMLPWLPETGVLFWIYSAESTETPTNPLGSLLRLTVPTLMLPPTAELLKYGFAEISTPTSSASSSAVAMAWALMLPAETPSRPPMKMQPPRPSMQKLPLPRTRAIESVVSAGVDVGELPM